MAPLTPVHFFSHGSTMMLGETTTSASYWKSAGDAALAHGIRGVIMMGAHWDSLGSGVLVSANPSPSKSPVAYVHPDKYASYALNPDLDTAPRCVSLLRGAGIPADEDRAFDWVHDTYLILIRMFPGGCPPTTLVSMNFRFDPHLHCRVGAALRPLRRQGYLVIGSGGAVHNLYRNRWGSMLRFGDNLAQEVPPEAWALGFRQAVEDVVRGCSSGGGGGDGDGGGEGKRKIKRGALRRGMTRLMKHPLYREAHATDDHFMAALFVAGAVDGVDDDEEEGEEEEAGDGFDQAGGKGELMAETWELTNMCNSQFTFGSWPKTVGVA